MSVSVVPALYGNDQPLHRVNLVPWENHQLLKCCCIQEEYLHIFGNPLLKALPEVLCNHLVFPETKSEEKKCSANYYFLVRRHNPPCSKLNKCLPKMKSNFGLKVSSKIHHHGHFPVNFQSAFPVTLRWLFLLLFKITSVTPAVLLSHFEEVHGSDCQETHL